MRAHLAAVMVCAGLVFGGSVQAADVYESFTFEGKAYTKARLVEVTPVDLLFIPDSAPGGLRIKRQELPPELSKKYPYDPVKAAEYEKEKIAKAKAQREQQRADIYATLLRQEKEVQAKIDAKNDELISVQKDIKTWRAKPKGNGKAVGLDQLTNKKIDLTHQVEALKKQLEGIRQQQAQYR